MSPEVDPDARRVEVHSDYVTDGTHLYRVVSQFLIEDPDPTAGLEDCLTLKDEAVLRSGGAGDGPTTGRSPRWPAARRSRPQRPRAQ